METKNPVAHLRSSRRTTSAPVEYVEHPPTTTATIGANPSSHCPPCIFRKLFLPEQHKRGTGQSVRDKLLIQYYYIKKAIPFLVGTADGVSLHEIA
eukprot:6450592-Pyramimonas_sp.AAC.1